MDNDSEMDSGMLSQAELDALIAGAGLSDESDEMELGSELGGSEPPLSATAAGMVDLPSFDLPASTMGGTEVPEGTGGLGRVRDIPLEVTVELGRTRLLIRDILDLSSGSIIELDKIAGEAVDLFANGLLVARGEVIVIDDNFGVRVTEIITAAARQGADKERHALAA